MDSRKIICQNTIATTGMINISWRYLLGKFYICFNFLTFYFNIEIYLYSLKSDVWSIACRPASLRQEQTSLHQRPMWSYCSRQGRPSLSVATHSCSGVLPSHTQYVTFPRYRLAVRRPSASYRNSMDIPHPSESTLLLGNI